MKKIFVIAAAFAALAVSQSCNKNDIDSPIKAQKEYDGPITLVKAGFSDETKTALGEKDGNKWSVEWSAGDAIMINSIASSSITIDTDNHSSATFEFQGALDYPYHALTPAALAKVDTYIHGTDADTVTVTLPATQTYVAGSYDPAAAVMLGYAEDGNLLVKSAMSFLQIKIQGGTDSDAIKSVRVRSNTDLNTEDGDYGRQPMSGDFTAVIGAEAGKLVAGIKAGQSVTLDCGAGVAQGTDLFIAIPAQKYTKGINIFIVDANGHYQEIVSTKPFEAAAGSIYPTTIAFNGGGEYQGPGIYTAEDWNTLSIQITVLGACTDFEDASGVNNVYADITTDKLQRFGGSTEGANNSVFAGKINGNNHTINVTGNTVPLFTYISGELKNCKFTGSKPAFSGTSGWGTAQIALTLQEGAVIENVTADYDVTAVPTADAVTYYYGMFRYIEAGATVTNCEQKSDFTLDYDGVTTKDLYVAPFAYYNKGTVSNCANSGNVTFAKDPGQKAYVAPITTNYATIDGFVNTGDFTVTASAGADVAGIVVYGGGYINNCVNGADGTEKGKIAVNTPSASGKTYHAAGIAAYGDANSASNCARIYRCTNFAPVSLVKTTAVHIYRSSVAGILADVRYGAYGTEKTSSFDNVCCFLDYNSNKGHLTIHEPDDAAASSAAPVFLGGIVGCIINKSGTSSGALILTKTTTELPGNYIVIRKDNSNTGTLEMASANGQAMAASTSGARQCYVGGIAGFAYGIGNSSTTSTSNAHYAVIRGTQNGVFKVGSSVQGNIAAGGILGGGCYAKVEQASATVTYEKTALKTKNADALYRGGIAAVIGWVVKYSDVTAAVPGTLTDNTGLAASTTNGAGTFVGYAGITGATSAHTTTTKETHKINVKTGSTYNGDAVSADNVATLVYGGGSKAVN